MTRDSWKRYSATRAPGDTMSSYPGFKSNMTDMCAAIGLVQLRRLADLAEGPAGWPSKGILRFVWPLVKRSSSLACRA